MYSSHEAGALRDVAVVDDIEVFTRLCPDIVNAVLLRCCVASAAAFFCCAFVGLPREDDLGNARACESCDASCELESEEARTRDEGPVGMNCDDT